jgi:hypothetical protein
VISSRLVLTSGLANPYGVRPTVGGVTVKVNVRMRGVFVLVAAAALVALWATSSLAVGCPRIKFVTLGDRYAEIGWTMGKSESGIPNFGGYRVWIDEEWTPQGFILAVEYLYNDQDPDTPVPAGYWPFESFYDDSVRVFRATDVQEDDLELKNAFPYNFSVTTFGADGDTSGQSLCRKQSKEAILSLLDPDDPYDDPEVLYPNEGPKNRLRKIQVIPNPYRSGAAWETGGERRVSFVGLPATATIRIYTAAGTHVRTLRHGDEQPPTDQESWDLKNDDGDEVAPGVYVWLVESGELGSAAGKVMIIK